MFAIGGSKALEIVARVALIYGACLVLLRASGQRELSELSQLLVMLLISETVSPALTGGDSSVTGGVIAAAALLALYTATGWLAFRSRRADSPLEGTAAVLIEDGRVRPDVVRRLRITDAALRTTLRQHGVLHVGEVKRAFVEAGGEITVIKKAGDAEARPLLRRGRPPGSR